MTIDNQDFKINERGAWSGSITNQHAHDPKLAQQLTDFFLSKNATSVLDLGAGPGLYTKTFLQNGIFASCYDGNPDTQSLSQGRCAILDLSFEINLSRHDWLLCLEVGEHLPKQYEDTLFKNIVKSSKSGVIMSWAVPGQGGDGHVNCQSNAYIKARMADLGYVNNQKAENILRESSTLSWFKDTIMVFETEQVTFGNSTLKTFIEVD